MQSFWGLSAQDDGQNDNRQDHSQDDQQATGLIPGRLLMPRCGPKFRVRTPGVIPHALDILADYVQLLALLVHHVRHVPEELVQLSHALLNVSDLALALNDQALLEVDLVLRSEAQLFLFLLELLRARSLARGRSSAAAGVFESCASGGCRSSLLFDGAALEHLELGKRGFEFAIQLALGEFLGCLCDCVSAVSGSHVIEFELRKSMKIS